MPVLDTAQQFQGLIARLNKKDVIAVDTETTGLDWKKDRCLGIGLAGDSQTGYFGFLPKDKTTQKDLRRLLANEKIAKVFHNAKFDMHFLREAGYPVAGQVFDTLIMARLWNENRHNHKLKDLATELVDPTAGETMDKLKEWMAQNKKDWSDLESVPPSILAKYGANDPKITFGLFIVLKQKLEEAKIPWSLVEMKSKILARAYEMEAKGVCVNMPFLKRYQKDLLDEQAKLLVKMKKACGKLPAALKNFNPESDDQVAQVLTTLGWKSTKETDSGKPSVDKYVLAAFDHPFSKLLQEHRRLGTIRGTFVEGILQRAVKRQEGYVVHTTYNTAGAVTGRWSSQDPNLQNVDKKSRAREAFVPRKGRDLWLFDFKQIEPVVFAQVSESKRLQKAFRDGMDYHSLNASAAFGIPYEKVDPNGRERKIAKALGLAIMYQAGPAKAAQMMGVSLDEGRRILARYYEEFPEVKVFQRDCNKRVEDRAIEQAKANGNLVIHDWKTDWEYKGQKLPIKKVPKAGCPGEFWEFIDKKAIQEYGWIKNMYGMKRRLKIDDAYKGLNALCQGTAGAALEDAVCRIHEGTGHTPLLQVHDELGFELLKGPAGRAEAIKIKTCMEAVQDRFPDVPIRVDVAIASKHWGAEKEVKL